MTVEPIPSPISPTVTQPMRVVDGGEGLTVPSRWVVWGLYSAVLFLLGGGASSLVIGGNDDATLHRRVDAVENGIASVEGKLESAQALAAAAKQAADDSRDRITKLEVQARGFEVSGAEQDRLILKTLGVTALALTEINSRLSGLEGKRPDDAMSPDLQRRVNDLNLQYQLLETRVESRRQ